MLSAELTLEQFDQNGDKTHWVFVALSQEQAEQLHTADRRSFRVKGFIDTVAVAQLAIQPLKTGGYLLALNSTLRRKLGKTVGQTITLRLHKDDSALDIPDAFLSALCLEPEAQFHWEQLTPSHQRYYVNHITAAKTPETQLNRIAQSIIALANKWSFGEMIRAQRGTRNPTDRV